MSFKLDLEFGNIYEKKLVEIIPHDSYDIKQGYFPDYDVEITKENKKYTYEVKADRYSYRTGNLVLEYECRNKPSGINKTTADFYAYYVVKPYNRFELYIIPTEVLRTAITEKKYKRTATCGDYKASCVYVFDLRLFEEYKMKNVE